jgi:hypothetical protein
MPTVRTEITKKFCSLTVAKTKHISYNVQGGAQSDYSRNIPWKFILTLSVRLLELSRNFMSFRNKAVAATQHPPTGVTHRPQVEMDWMDI